MAYMLLVMEQAGERAARSESEARAEFSHAASLASNARERNLLLGRMAACEPSTNRIN